MLVQTPRQRDLDREVAKHTGEDVTTIRRRGFSVIDLQDDDFDPEPDLRAPFVLDWDDLDGHSQNESIASFRTIPA